MNLTKEVLKKIFPYADLTNLEQLTPWLNKYMQEHKINTYPRVCHFLAQAGHESSSFNRFSEMYDGKASEYFKKYEFRSDLGNVNAGDGEKFRGRGIFQLTGRYNYHLASNAIFGDDRLIDNPKLVETPEIAVLTACWFWFTRHLNDLADKDEFKAITQKINGGLNGLAERKYFLDKAKMCITSECFIVIPDRYEN